MYRLKVKLIGRADEGGSDAIMHADNPEWKAQIKKWLSDPINKKMSVPGDDRTPAHTWLGYCYHDGNVLGIPSDNLMTAIRSGAAMVNVPGSARTTYKKASQSALLVNEILWPIKINGHTIPWPSLESLVDERDFNVHMKRAKELGFELFVKPVKIGRNKHIRVRPRFSNWTAEGTITVLDDNINIDLVRSFWENTGTQVGIMDWRPSASMSPGPFGMFAVEVAPL